MSAQHTPFNPDRKAKLSYRECLGPAMAITEPADAQQYLAAYTAFIQRALDGGHDANGKTAAQIAKINLGYYAGYCDHETRLRVESLFECNHPVFGAAANGAPTPAAALAAGIAKATSQKGGAA
jgi:hypothetical protein